MDCLFCKIINGEVPSEKIYEDEHSFAFLDINPVNPGHTLLAPKEHSRNILDISEKSLGNITPLLKKISNAVKEGVGADGINIHINNEPLAGQVIFHTHIHIIPRFEKDGYKLWHGDPYKEGEALQTAEKIREELK